MIGARHRAIAAFAGQPSIVSSAPGRVNLIGEHTDYNDGFVFPMALPFSTVIAAASAPEESVVRLSSEGFGTVEFDPMNPLDGPADWSIHLRGVHALLAAEGVRVGPWRGSIASDIPLGASLSSSAALEVACIGAVLRLAHVDSGWSRERRAQLGQRVENEVVGLPSGIMDQLISATARAGHASLIDCRTFEAAHHPVPTDCVVVVMDTATRRELVESEYAARRADCEGAARAIGVDALRDASTTQVAALADDRLRRRARHVVTENQRTLAAADAMAADDSGRLGELMAASHASLRDDYEVSGPQLDAIVDTALDAPGCLGARMTGGGFAGCAVALVEASRAAEFERAVSSRYTAATGREPVLWPVTPGPGAQVVEL